jgi:Tol biopolymer transport system component
MTRFGDVPVLCVCLVVAACGTEPDTGAVEITTVSNGPDVDWDGYTVHIAGAGSLFIGPNATVRFPEVPAGDREVNLTAIRGNCRVQGPHPVLVRVPAEETFHLNFEVACAHAPLLARMVISKARRDSSHIYAMSPDGTSQYRLTRTELWESSPSISPDGTRILFLGYVRYEFDFRGYGDAYVMNADGTGLEALTHGDGDVQDPAWSPDGSRIAFAQDYDIYVMNADGTDALNITRTPTEADIAPGWSPDSRRILFLGSPSDGFANYYIMNPDGSGRSRVTNDSTAKGDATWSPDGSRIAFMALDPSRDQGWDLYLMDADGSGRVRLTDLPGSEYTPSWSPDGLRIAFSYLDQGTGQFDLHTIRPDGTGLKNVSNTADFSEGIGAHPWGP